MSMYRTHVQVQFCSQSIFAITLNLTVPLYSKYADYKSFCFSFISTSHYSLVRMSDITILI